MGRTSSRWICGVVALLAICCSDPDQTAEGLSPPPVEDPPAAPAPLDPNYVLYPLPRHARVEAAAHPVKTLCVDTSALPDSGPVNALLPELAEEALLDLGDPGAGDCDLSLRFTKELPPLPEEARAVWQAAPADAQRFVIVPGGQRPDLLLFAKSARGGLFALRRALQLVSGDKDRRAARAATVVDYPGFSPRGIVEGFYGPPYTRAERARLLSLMGRMMMNIYLYGPKNDDHARDRWREPYPEDAGQAIREAVRYCDEHLIDFLWSISPGLVLDPLQPEGAIRFSSNEDLAALIGKLEEMRKLGVRRFALFLDDVHDGLVWPEDRARFPDLAHAHVYLINRVVKHLRDRDAAARLFFVGTRYAKDIAGWEDYNQTLGRSLDERVDVMWTGNRVYSYAIAPVDLHAINRLLLRKVVLWDNAPIKVGPIATRDLELVDNVGGYLFNPVLNEWRVYPPGDFFKVVGPQGDYLWNPVDYSPRDSFETWQRILAEDAGPT